VVKKHALAESPILDVDLDELDEWPEPPEPVERRRTPYDRLLRAVLREAVSDLRSRDESVRADAEAWFADDTGGGDRCHYTFEQIAAHFHLDANAIRAALPRLRTPLPPGRRRPRMTND
jgi:hypothetical protein